MQGVSMAGISFKGKVVLVTGASSGIGADAARLFAKFGATLVLTGRNIENLKIVENDCGGNVLLIPADLSKEDDIKNIINQTIGKYKQLDVLVNNAGIYENGGIKNSSLEQFDRIMNVNMRAIYLLTMLAVPYLIKTKGNIVNVSSIVGTRSFPGILSYSISKSALDQFTKCTAIELASDGIRVNAVNPGLTRTNIILTLGMSQQESDEFYETAKDTHPLGRAGYATEVADSIVFLASDMASFITGANLPIDGGRHLTCLRTQPKQ